MDRTSSAPFPDRPFKFFQGLRAAYGLDRTEVLILSVVLDQSGPDGHYDTDETRLVERCKCSGDTLAKKLRAVRSKGFVHYQRKAPRIQIFPTELLRDAVNTLMDSGDRNAVITIARSQ